MANDSNVLATWGNKQSMNLNSLLLNNIMASQYFKVTLYEKKNYLEVVDEIYYQVKHLEPWERGSRKTSGLTGMCGGVRGVSGGGIVSTAYSILYKLYTLKLTRKEIISLTIHTDSPFIRAIGFMYIRYTQPPNELFEWFEEYLDDTESLDVKAGGGGIMSIGQMLRRWLTQIEWYDTLFPRIPVSTQKEITEKLRAHGPYKGDDYGEYSSYDYDEGQQGATSSTAIDMPETFGNVASSSSSNDRNGNSNNHHYSSSDSHRDKKYRSSRDDRSRSRSPDRRRHHHRDDSSDRHKHHQRRRSSPRDDRRRNYHRSPPPSDTRSRNDRHDRS